MYVNSLTKYVLSKVITKMTGLDGKLPKDERERVSFLVEISRSWDTSEPDDMEGYIKVNCLILTTIWYSNHDYDAEIQIEALTNILREYRRDPSIEEFTIPGVGAIDCQQMLIRNYVESYRYSDDLIKQELIYYRELLGYGEQLAFFDEMLNYLGARGNFSELENTTKALLSLPEGEHSDCYACIINRLIRLHIMAEKFEQASVLIDKIFDDDLSCDHIPKRTHIQKLLVDTCLSETDEVDVSAEKKALKSLDDNDSEIFEAGFLLTYALITRRVEVGQQVIDRFADIIGRSDFPETIWYCQAASEIDPTSTYRKRGLDLAKEFDARNGNDFYEGLFS